MSRAPLQVRSLDAERVSESKASEECHERLAAACRPYVDDLFEPRPLVYWLDFWLTLFIAYTSASYYLRHPFATWSETLAFVVAALALYRLSMFLHEIVHFRHHQMRTFATTWNLLAGIPLLMPTFLYESHLAHHNPRYYGTTNDGEYLPLGRGTIAYLGMFLLQIFIQPLFVFTRFLIAAPLAWIVPSIRRWVWERMSSLVINFQYRRAMRMEQFSLFDRFMEVACALRAWALVMVVVMGVAPWTHFLAVYALACVALGLNHLRTLAAHRYVSDGGTISHDEQFLDSTNIEGGWITGLICPVGLRFHALHHLLPGIPYHDLGKAHRRLKVHLEASSPYHAATCATFSSAVGQLVDGILRRGERPDIRGRMSCE